MVSYILDYDKICERNELKKILDCGLWKQAWVEKRGKCSSVVIVLWNAYDGKIQQLRVSIPPISLPLPLHALPKKQLSLNPSWSPGILKNIIPTDLPAPHYLNTPSKYVRVKYYENGKGAIFVPPPHQNPCHFPDLSLLATEWKRFPEGWDLKSKSNKTRVMDKDIMQIRHIAGDRQEVPVPVTLWERSGPIWECCPLAPTCWLFVWKMSAKASYKPVAKRSSSELIDVLDGSETSVTGMWSITYFYYTSRVKLTKFVICDAQVSRDEVTAL